MSNKSNVEFVTELMESSSSGAMMQLVVMQALITYTEHMILHEKQALEQMERSLISGPAWMVTVKELQAKLNERMLLSTKASKKTD